MRSIPLCVHKKYDEASSSGDDDEMMPWRSSWQVQHTRRCRRHIAKHKNGKWFDETLGKAMNVVTDHGMKLRVALRVYEIPTNSFKDQLYGKTRTKKRGNKPTLKPDEKKNSKLCFQNAKLNPPTNYNIVAFENITK